MENYFAKKENVIEWFGERGIFLSAEAKDKGLYLDEFKWINGKLFFIISGKQSGYSGICKTEVGEIDMCYTHRRDGSIINIYALYGSFVTTFENLDLVVTKLEKLEKEEQNRELEYEITRQKENEELIGLVQNNDILIKNNGMSHVQFFQVIDVDKTIKQIKIKELQKYYLSRSIGMDYIVSYKSNEFKSDAKEIILNKKSSIPSIFKEKTALEYVGN